MYKLLSFNGVTLPEFIKDKTFGPVSIENRILNSIDGAYDYFGLNQSYGKKQTLSYTAQIVGDTVYIVDHTGAFIVDHAGNFIIAGSPANRLRAQYESIASQIGQSGLLVRERHDDGVRHERRCVLSRVTPKEIVLGRFAEVDLEFNTAQPYWHAQTDTEGTVAFTTNTIEGFAIGNRGNATVFDAVMVLEASSTITELTITNITSGVTVSWAGTINSGENFVIDCNKQTVEIDGLDVYSGFSFTGNRWCPVVPGMNVFNITTTGNGVFTLSFREQWV